MKRASVFLAAAVLLLVGFEALPQEALAVQTMPPTTTSWYVANISGDTDSTLYTWAYNKGYEAGQKDLNLSGTQSSLVILDFGAPVVKSGISGASTWGRFVSVATVREAARQFASGYWVGTGSDWDSQLYMLIGTSNSGSSVTNAHGKAWSYLVQDIGSDLQYYGYSSQVRVYGAIDIEPGFSSPSVAKSWTQGYNSVWKSPYYYFNYGSADGCPQSGTTATPRVCDGGWNQDDINYVSWQGGAYPLPEIYSTAGGNAKSWQQLSLYAYLKYGRAEVITAPLTQYGACQQKGGCSGTNNTAATAWSQLWTRLNSDSRTAQPLYWSTDIKWRQ